MNISIQKSARTVVCAVLALAATQTIGHAIGHAIARPAGVATVAVAAAPVLATQPAVTQAASGQIPEIVVYAPASHEAQAAAAAGREPLEEVVVTASRSAAALRG